MLYNYNPPSVSLEDSVSPEGTKVSGCSSPLWCSTKNTVDPWTQQIWTVLVPIYEDFFFSVNIQPASSGFSPSDSNNCRSKFLYLVGWICEMLWKEESTACHLNFPGKWVCLHIRAFNSSKNWLNHMQHRFRIKDCWSFSRIQSPSSVQPGRCKVHFYLPKERT